mmetsp:Transcript_11786/g.31210  ORF Transcript_11786/g.31210 Transcript_11786/m.31210 type:complete len:182 (+) Transcript_11786:99-644(+)
MAEEAEVPVMGGMEGGEEGEGGEAPDMAEMMKMLGGMKGGGKGGDDDGEGGGGMDMEAMMQMLGGMGGGKGGGGMMGGKGGGMGGKGGGQDSKDDGEKTSPDGKYIWQQKGEEIQVRFVEHKELTKKDIKVKFGRFNLKVEVKGEVVVDGKLFFFCGHGRVHLDHRSRHERAPSHAYQARE